MHIKSTINGILRAYPIIMMYSTMMLYIMSSDLDYLYLLIVLWIGEGINYNLKYFFNPILRKDNSIAAMTSSIGLAEGYPKFHKTTPINQIM